MILVNTGQIGYPPPHLCTRRSSVNSVLHLISFGQLFITRHSFSSVMPGIFVLYTVGDLKQCLEETTRYLGFGTSLIYCIKKVNYCICICTCMMMPRGAEKI